MTDTRLSDGIIAVAALLFAAWAWRNIWVEDVRKDETATDEAWHDGAEKLRRAREDR